MKQYITAVVLTVCICGILAGMLLMWQKKKMQRVMDQVLQKLDRAAGGEFQEVSYDESMDSAITERLNRLLGGCQIHREDAEQERSTVKSLISDISHQIRTPLTNIMLYAGILSEQKLERDSQVLADKILSQSEKLDFFMRELVKTSYTETEMLSLKPEMSCVDELIDRACQSAELSALKKNILIDYEDTGIVCRFDMKWTVEAVGNVLENAVKYSPEGTKIQIRVKAYESFACIEVKDCGIGIKEEEQGLIFQRFYRSKDVVKEQGFGIGLYLTREILTRQGGYIKVDSEYGKGSVFSIFLLRNRAGKNEIED